MGMFRRLLSRDALPLAAALLSVLLTLPALWSGLLFDDYPMRLMLLQHPDSVVAPEEAFSAISGDPETTHEFMNLGFLPWWTADDLRLAFLRPITIATHRLDYAVWPDSPALMHLHSLLWLGALVGLAAILYRRLMGPAWIAGLAAILYAIDDAPAYPATWLANRNALVATVFGLAALIFHDRWRSERWKPGMWLAPAALGLALFSAEFGLATAAYLLAYALFLEGHDGDGAETAQVESAMGAAAAGWKQRLASLVPYAPVLATWMLVYRLGGYGTEASGFYIDPLRQTTQFLWALAERAPILLLGQWALPYADEYSALAGADALMLWLRAVGLVVLLAIVLAPLLRRSPSARFWATGMLLSLVPVCATAPSNRLLLFIGLGAMGLLAQFLGGLADGAEWRPRSRPRRWITVGMAGLLVLVNVAAAPLLHPLVPLALPLIDAPVRAAMLSIPDDPGLADQTLVILNAADHLVFVTDLWPMRLLANLPMAARVRPLVTQPVALDITRTDARTLTIAFEGGLYRSILGWLFRGHDRPMRAGQVVELDGMSVEVTGITPDGVPTEAVFRFDRALEDPSLRWVRWSDGVFVPFVPPAVGETLTLPAPRNPLEARPAEMLENYRRAVDRMAAGGSSGAGSAPR